MTDEIILDGFKSLHQAMAEGFDATRAQLIAQFRAELKELKAELKAEFRAEFAASDQRMMRHFDKRDERLDGHEARITKLEASL